MKKLIILMKKLLIHQEDEIKVKEKMAEVKKE